MKNKQSKNIVYNSSINSGGDTHIGDIINIHQVKEENEASSQNFNVEESQNLKVLISKNKIKKALELLIGFTGKNDKDLYNQVIGQSQRWNNLQEEKRKGIISSERESILSNRIIYAILGILDELEKSI